MADPFATPERRPASARKTHLTTAERLGFCAEWSTATAHGMKARLLRAWKVSATTAKRLWRAFSSQRAANSVINMSRGQRSGRPSMLATVWHATLTALSPHKRTSMRRWARAADMSHCTLWRWSKKMEVKRHTRFIKPALTTINKALRLAFVRRQVMQPNSRRPVFHDHYDVVHIDEKWFYLLRDGQHIFLAPGETPPGAPKVKHKSHIPKAMFIALGARPQPQRGFDGKIGVFPCTEWVKAKRSSKNWACGEDKEIDVPVTAEYYRTQMEKALLPAIVKAMPWAGRGGRKLIVQHDGAKPHTGKGNTEYWRELVATAYPDRNIEVVVQPAQSPDLNVLDLGFFSSLQRKVDETDPSCLAALFDHIDECYWEYDTDTLERVWQALFNVYNCILQEGGGNEYLLPHTGVRRRQDAGLLERCVAVDRKAFTETAAAQAH